MKIFFQLGVLVSALWAAAALAQSPSPLHGTVLLLENDRILEGKIDRVGDLYRIRREGGGELSLPVVRAKRLCADRDEVVRVMRSQANLRDPDERIRLARWCHANNLRTHALEEARAAQEMRPDHPETNQLVQMLNRLILSAGAAANPPAVPAATPSNAGAKPKGPTSYDVSQDGFVAFAAKVQPILLNACYSCHHEGKGAGLELRKPSENGYKGAAQFNLQAILPFVAFEKPSSSPLVLKAVSPHGGAGSAPIKSRQSPAFGALAQWVEQLCATHPHLREARMAELGPVFGSTSAKRDYAPPTVAPLPTPSPTPPSATKIEPSVGRPPALPSALPPLPLVLPPPPGPPPSAVPPSASPQTGPTNDPFDPEAFNKLRRQP